ncbi:hypothetical protein CROQUDRAFT_671272 [Cronartium quercuum f. sp. fusiforme G11]|uniref:Uncharacterized protein n=1 Tax=Cronartium quercuum f. sp. fusiforme G11 TaxID=708437 RepID=A0A9P6NMM6_9BASI|nr:hypothetical protein CROQUDRAFT_671272 [Cronartium quercuum f. sp. fusiforme G11]
MAPRPLSHSRRQRGLALPPRPPYWRPRVSSPLASEIVFADKEEKTDSIYISIDPHNRLDIPELEHVSRPRAFHIILSLLIDCLLSFLLCRIALDSMLNLRNTISTIPPSYKAEGKVMFCLPIHNADPQFVALADYPILPVGIPLSEFTELPDNCGFLPSLLVKLDQSASLSNFIPLFVTCFITLKLAFGLLFLRTSPNPRSPLNYLRNAVIFHFFFTYFTVLILKLNYKSILHRYPALEKIMTTSSEFMFFVLGFFACLCMLSLVVMPLLWIFSVHTGHRGRHETSLSPQSTLPTTHCPSKGLDARGSFVMSEKGLSAIPKQKKKALFSSF